MKKLTKILVAILSLLAITSFALACAPNEGENNNPPQHTHAFSTEYYHDNDYHWFECECGEDKGKTAHSFTDGKCSCGYEKEEAGGQTPTTPEHTHNFDRTTSHDDYLKSKATCENKAVYYYACKCGEKGTKTYEFGNALGHSYGEWVSNGDGTHTKICANDNTHKVTEDCYVGYNGSYATCAKKAVCGYCNAEFGELEPHRYASEYSHDENRHWQEVTCGCDIEPTYENHGTEGNACVTCEYPFKPTDGIIYDKSADGTYAEVIGYEGSAKKIRIADTYQGLPVKNIYDGAFEDTDVTFVIIPDSIKGIGDSAFYGCDLTSVVIPDGVTSIGNSAFYDCDLTSVVIPDSVTSIGAMAFYYCTSLTSVEIPDSVTSIGSSAFYGCDLTSVVIPDSVKSIGYFAFYGCDSLTSVVIGSSVESIGKAAFFGCDKLQFNEYGNCKYLGSSDNDYYALVEVTNKNLSSYTIHENTKIIADDGVCNCGRLSSIEIPDSVTSIGDSAFSNCTSLTSVEIGSSVTSIGNSAFYGCDSLTSENITVKDPNGWQYKSDDTWYDISGSSVANYIKNRYILRKK